MKNSYLLIFLFLLGCGPASDKNGAENGANGEAARIRVATIHPERKTLIRRTEQPGQIEAFEETPLVAKEAGYVRAVHVDIGDSVQGPTFDDKGNVVEGQVLADLWIPEVEEGWKEKVALVTQAEAEVKQAAAAVKVAQANRTSFEALAAEATAALDRVQARYDRWNSEFTRMTSLAAAGSVSRKVAVEAEDEFRAADAARKEAQARIRSAEAQLGQSEAAIEKAEADEEAAAARLKVAEAERDLAAALRKYAVIRAPFSGTIAERNVHTGHFVQPATGNGKPLLVVVQTETVRIFVDVPEEDAVLVEEGGEAKLRVPSMGNQEFPGVVTRTSWVLNPANRTLRTEIDVENKDGKLRPGMYAYADLKVAERKDVFALPKSAIMTQGSQHSCWTIDPAGKIVRTPLTLGIRSGPDVEVVSGLSGEEEVIGVNPAAFREGQEVEITKPAK
jgi:HlyD family secretion protein